MLVISAIYASPRLAERRVLWNNLSAIPDLLNMPWVMADEFNEPPIDSDKLGGRPVSILRSLEFKDCLDKCFMVDLGFSSPRFTWNNKRDVGVLIQERIDRFFVNPGWCSLYPDARVSHLTRCHSDHCPVLLELKPRSSINLSRPFKFQSCWLADPGFPRVVERAWSQENHLKEAISRSEKEAIGWNKDHFGNIFVKKRNIMARLNGIQHSLARCPSTSLIELKKMLQKDLDLILNQERDLWAMKSRINWLVQGERNTAFYHVSTLVRRKRNRIYAIQNNVDDWVSEERDVMNFVRKGFEDLFSTTKSLSHNTVTPPSRW